MNISSPTSPMSPSTHYSTTANASGSASRQEPAGPSTNGNDEILEGVQETIEKVKADIAADIDHVRTTLDRVKTDADAEVDLLRTAIEGVKKQEAESFNKIQMLLAEQEKNLEALVKLLRNKESSK